MPGFDSARKDCLYSKDELATILPYKTSYIQQNDREKRATMCRQDILPKMLGHWADIGALDGLDDIAIRTKTKVCTFAGMFFFTQSQVCRQEFCAWLANSWRPERGIARMSNQFKVKKPDLLWRTQKDRVLKEIASILGVTEATTNTPGWFTARLTAMKNILQGMSAVEKKAFDEEIKGIQKQGYEPDVQRRYVTCNVKGAGLNAGVH
jgi:hypothetical protein